MLLRVPGQGSVIGIAATLGRGGRSTANCGKTPAWSSYLNFLADFAQKALIYKAYDVDTMFCNDYIDLRKPYNSYEIGSQKGQAMKRMKHTSIWMFGNNKGGVGKTTISLNMAAAISEMNKTCLYIDIDDSTNSSFHLKLEGSGEGAFPVSRLFMDKTVNVVDCLQWQTKLPGVALIRSERGLKKDLAQFVNNNEKREIEAMSHRFANKLQELDGLFDFIIIDVGPSMDSALGMVLEAVTHYVFVADSSQYAEQGIYNVLEDVPRLNPGVEDGIELVGAVYSNINMNSNFARSIVTRKDIASGVPLIPIFIPHRVEVPENMLSGGFAVGPGKDTVLADSFRRLRGVMQDRTQVSYPGAIPA